jgi:hypothetical protein
LLSDDITSSTLDIRPIKELRAAINKLDPKKAPGYDLITLQILKKMPETGIEYISQLYTAVLKQDFFLSHCRNYYGPKAWQTFRTHRIL